MRELDHRMDLAVYRQFLLCLYNRDTDDHFYTTVLNGENASQIGYEFLYIACALISLNIPQELVSNEMVKLYRWCNGVTCDHFYTTDPTGELAPMLGYRNEGDVGYIFTNPSIDRVPLYRWRNGRGANHYYSTNPNPPNDGYISEGIQGYVFPCSQ